MLIASFIGGVIATVSTIAGVALLIWIMGRRRGWWDKDEVPPDYDDEEEDDDQEDDDDPEPPTPTADLTVIFVHETGKRTWRQWATMGAVRKYCRKSDKLDCTVLDQNARNSKGQRVYVDLVASCVEYGLPQMAIVLRGGRFKLAVPMPPTKAKAIEIVKANGG